jgi:phospholipid/cholesterol/gamma-HCH transport system permease protein
LKISVDNEKLLISNLDEPLVGFKALQSAFDEVEIAITSTCSGCEIDMSAVKDTDYTQLAFIKSAITLCNERHLNYDFINIGKGMEAVTKELSNNLNYRPVAKAKSVYLVAGEATYELGADAIRLVSFFDALARSCLFYIRHPRKINWRETFYYIDSTGADAVPIILMICFLVGVIMGYQGADALGAFGLNVYIADLVGMSIVRELGPLMVSIICAGRAGSAFAAELGTMKVNEELDAMHTMGLKPERSLVIPKIIALMCVMPLLTIMGDMIGIIGGGLLATILTDISASEFVGRVIDYLVLPNIVESLLKSVVFAFLIGSISCFRGFHADNDAKGVGNAATSAVVSSIFLVVVADAFITIFFPAFLRIFGINYGIGL